MEKEIIFNQQFIGRVNSLMAGELTFKSIYEVLTKVNKKQISSIFEDTKGKIRTHKYSNLDKKSNLIAYKLKSKVSNHDGLNIVILKYKNCQNWAYAFWGILKAGFIPLLLDAKMSVSGVENVINQNKVNAIISDDSNTYSCPKIDPELVLESKEKIKNFNCEWADEVIFCTSGTTGDSKLMVFNGEAMCNQINCAKIFPFETKDLMYSKKNGDVKILAMLPFHHIFGFVAVYLWFSYFGKSIVYPQSNKPTDIAKLCQRVGITHIFSVPMFWDSFALSTQRKIKMADESKKEILDKLFEHNINNSNKKKDPVLSIAETTLQKSIFGNKVRFCISGGGYLSKETQSYINGLGYKLYNGFGMTELGISSVERDPDINNILKGSIGLPFYGVEYALGKENSELLVKSNFIHHKEIIGGKYKNTVLDENGFFATGDIAEIDKDGRVFIKGRLKDVIINSNGENIYPDELENCLKNLQHVTNLSILGIKNKNSSKELIILVVETDNMITTENIPALKKEIKEAEKSFPHKAKLDIIYLSKGKLPLANNMKVKRFEIKKQIESGSSDYFTIDSIGQTSKEEISFSPETEKKILKPIKAMFSKVLSLPDFKVDNDAHWVNKLGGDSMNYIELITMIQDKFKIEFKEEDLGNLACVNDFTRKVEELLNAKHSNK